jgi:hypothetical protein
MAMGNANNADLQRAAAATTRQDRGVFATTAGVIGGSVFDLVDTVASSIPVVSRSLGIERGDFNSAMLRAVDSPNLTDFYQDNKGAIEVGSGIAGVIAAELVSRRVTAPAGALMQGLKTLPWARRIATLDTRYEGAMRTLRAVDTTLAKRGALGAEQFVGSVVRPTEGLFANSLMAGREITRKAALRSAVSTGVLRTTRNAAVTEAIMGVTLNQNGFLYSDDMSHNIMWMAAGLAIPGAFDAAATRYSARKFVNSDYIRRTYANALDPAGEESARVGLFGRKLEGKSFAGISDLPAGQGFLGGAFTDEVTSLLTNAKSARSTPTEGTIGGQGLFANRDRLATQHFQLAREEIQKVTTKGVEGNGATRFGNKTANSSGAMNHIDQVMTRDPAGFHGIEEIGVVPDGQMALVTHQGRENRITELLRQKQEEIDNAIEAGDPKFDFERAEGFIRRYKWKQQFIPQPLIDGERATLSDLRALDEWVEPTIAPGKKIDDKTTLFETEAEHITGRVGLDTNLQTYLPANRDLAKADHFDMLRLYRLGNKLLKHSESTALDISLPQKPTWFQLDLAEQLQRKNPNTKIAYPAGMTREQAMVESFAQKAEVLKSESRKGQMKKSVEARKGNEYDPAVEASKLRVRLNLPKLTAYERAILGTDEHPVEQLLRGASNWSPDEIRNMTYSDLMKGASDVKRIGDFAPTTPTDFKDLGGNSFFYMMDEAGNPTKPVLMYSRPLNEVKWSPDDLADRMAAQREYMVNRLIEGDDLTAQISKGIYSSSELDAVARTNELMEPQIQGSVLGSNHLTPGGAAIKGLKNQDWIARDNKTLLAASRIQQMVQRLARDNFQREAMGLQDVVQRLDSPRAASSKLLLNQFIAYRPGWDLQVKKKQVDTILESLDNGQEVRKFILAPTQQNQERWQQMFGEAMPEGAVLRGANGRDVVLDDVGMEFMTQFSNMTESIRTNKNKLLTAQSLKQIEKLPMYVPPSNLNGKFIGFTMDAEGNVVRGMSVIADTESDFARQQAKIMQQIEEKGLNGYRFRTREDIKRFADIWDRAQMDMIDPGTTAIQGGKRQRGLLAGSEIDLRGVEGILNTVRDQYMNHAQDVLSTMFKDQLKNSESRANIATAMSRNNANPSADQKYKSVHNMYIENLTGQSPLHGKGSFYGGLYNWVEGKADQMLASMHPGYQRVWAATNSFIDRSAPWSKGEGARRDFDSLSSHLGEYMPFKSAAEYAERQGMGGMPPRAAEIAGQMNKFTASVMLRVMEPVMALMNLSGMVNAMPSVIRHVQQQAGETAEAFSARVGGIATVLPPTREGGPAVGVLNMGKLMNKGFRRAWNKTSEADYDYMRRNGFLTQEVAEFQRQFGAIESKADWDSFFLEGSKTKAADHAAAGNKIRAKIHEKGIAGWMSILTDKSEDFSRSWGHMVGVELAEQMGIKGMEAKHTFAHDMANKMIANYNPANRPEVFQGALGAPIGLFQSFIINYYQRIFRYAETGDYGALATQYATQAGLFGATTVPGWAAASQLFFDHSKGDVDPLESIQAKFGESTGDLLAYGTLGSIPKLFGAEGIALSSRADTAFRMPAIPIIGNAPPAVTVAQKVFGGLWNTAKLFSDKNPHLTATQLGEVLSNMIPNRPIAGMVEGLAGGNDTDDIGQLVSSNLSMMETVYRGLGVRSMRQAKDVEAFYANKNQQALRLSGMDIMRQSTRSAFRKGDFEAVPKILEKYIEGGGDPADARRWLKSQYEAATETRSERQLNESLKSPDKMSYAVRLLDAGVSIDEDEGTIPYSESLAVADEEAPMESDSDMMVAQ